MRKTTLHLWAALTVCACKATNPSEKAEIDGAPEPPTAAPGEAAEAKIRASMQGHDKHGDAMRDAMVRGDLDGAKAEAKLLAELRLAGPTSGLFRHLLDAMKDAAARASGANDLKDASRDVGVVAKTCGDCHTVFGRPGMVVGQPAAPASGSARPCSAINGQPSSYGRDSSSRPTTRGTRVLLRWQTLPSRRRH